MIETTSEQRDMTRPCSEGNGFYIPRNFYLAIELAREERWSRSRFMLEILRIQDELCLVCRECRTPVPVKIFTVDDARHIYELARRRKNDQLREEIDERYGEYIAVCPRCLRRGLLPLRIPTILDLAAEDVGDSNTVPAAGRRRLQI